MINKVRHLVEAGFAIHRLHPKSKRPVGEQWSTAPVATWDRLLKTYRPGENVGARLGQWSKVAGGFVHCADMDIRDAALAHEAHAALDRLVPGWRDYPMVASGSGGESRHVYFICDKHYPSKKLAHSEHKIIGSDGKPHWAWEIELFGTGKQVALPPSIHPDTGKPYRWLNPFEPLFAPSISSEIVAAWVEPTNDAVSEDEAAPLGLSVEQVRAYLRDLPNDDRDYDEWLNVMASVQHESQGRPTEERKQFYEAFREWSARSAKHDDRTARYKFKSFRNKESRRNRTMRSVVSEVQRTLLDATLDDAIEDLGEDDETGDNRPFRLTTRGVEKLTTRVTGKKKTKSSRWEWVCSHLEIKAETRNSDGKEWGRLLALTDHNGRYKTWAMPMSMLAGDGTAYREHLLSLGLIIAAGPSARAALHEYIATSRSTAMANCVSRIGWHGTTFMQSSGPAGGNAMDEQYILQTTGAADHAYREKGTLQDWQDRVARYAIGNSRLGLALSTAFAAALVHPTSSESGGFHFRGGSSTGKTTALIAAGSVWGGGGVRGYVRTWRATANGLEGTAAMHCDALLCLDEMGQVDGREAGQIAYMLANGVGKTRATRTGEARAAAEWRLLFLSSGELGLADKIAEDGRGRRVAAGQQVRVVDIPADAGAGLGLFENIHGFESGDAFARHLKRASDQHHGTAAVAFIKALTTNDLTETIVKVRGWQSDFFMNYCPSLADGQVKRVCGRFALVAAGGELAAEFGILPWPPGEAMRAAAKCFEDWIETRGGVDASEDYAAISTVRAFIEQHGASRFQRLDEDDLLEQRILNRVGYLRKINGGDVEYLFLPETWKSEVCAGLNAKEVARLLAEKGFLIQDSKGKSLAFRWVNGRSQRFYVVTENILGIGPRQPLDDIDDLLS